MDMFSHIYPFNHDSVTHFILKEASSRGISLSLKYILEHLEESDPIRQYFVWVLQEKGCNWFAFIDDIPLEELRTKMASLGFPTTQQELEERIPRIDNNEYEWDDEDVQQIKEFLLSKNHKHK